MLCVGVQWWGAGGGVGRDTCGRCWDNWRVGQSSVGLHFISGHVTIEPGTCGRAWLTDSTLLMLHRPLGWRQIRHLLNPGEAVDSDFSVSDGQRRGSSRYVQLMTCWGGGEQERGWDGGWWAGGSAARLPSNEADVMMSDSLVGTAGYF